jgi:hypothetical protein
MYAPLRHEFVRLSYQTIASKLKLYFNKTVANFIIIGPPPPQFHMKETTNESESGQTYNDH